MNELPDKLDTDAVYQTKGGMRFTLRKTRHKAGYGEPLYKLWYTAYGTTSSILWSRDSLAEDGVTVVEGATK